MYILGMLVALYNLCESFEIPDQHSTPLFLSYFIFWDRSDDGYQH